VGQNSEFIKEGAHIMESHTFQIPNISCGHCTMTIENELREMDGITDVQGDAAGKTVTVKWEAPVTEVQIRATLKEINYPAD
jgi:copper chaperone